MSVSLFMVLLGLVGSFSLEAESEAEDRGIGETRATALAAGEVSQRTTYDIGAVRFRWWSESSLVLVSEEPAPAGMSRDAVAISNPFAGAAHRISAHTPVLSVGALELRGVWHRMLDPLACGNRRDAYLAPDGVRVPADGFAAPWQGVAGTLGVGAGGAGVAATLAAGAGVAGGAGEADTPRTGAALIARARGALGVSAIALERTRTGQRVDAGLVRVGGVPVAGGEVELTTVALSTAVPGEKNERWIHAPPPLPSLSLRQLGVALRGRDLGVAETSVVVEGWRQWSAVTAPVFAGSCYAETALGERVRLSLRAGAADTAFRAIDGSRTAVADVASMRVSGAGRWREIAGGGDQTRGDDGTRRGDDTDGHDIAPGDSVERTPGVSMRFGWDAGIDRSRAWREGTRAPAELEGDVRLHVAMRRSRRGAREWSLAPRARAVWMESAGWEPVWSDTRASLTAATSTRTTRVAISGDWRADEPPTGGLSVRVSPPVGRARRRASFEGAATCAATPQRPFGVRAADVARLSDYEQRAWPLMQLSVGASLPVGHAFRVEARYRAVHFARDGEWIGDPEGHVRLIWQW